MLFIFRCLFFLECARVFYLSFGYTADVFSESMRWVRFHYFFCCLSLSDLHRLLDVSLLNGNCENFFFFLCFLLALECRVGLLENMGRVAVRHITAAAELSVSARGKIGSPAIGTPEGFPG